MSEYHIPVLLAASLESLQLNPDGIYIDATFGGGGHAREIIRRLGDKGHLLAFDQDTDAAANTWQDPRLTLIHSNFRHLVRWMQYYKVCGEVDGLLADLGVSSHQFDNPARGFSYRYDEPLDMRMNPKQQRTAEMVLNTYDEKSLQQLFSAYGEITNARTLAAEIVQIRTRSPWKTTGQLADLAGRMARGQKMRYLSQLFQALRIEINDELTALEELLTGAHEVLKPGGRVVVISYHSLEDRLVKRFLKSGNFEGERTTDMYGSPEKKWKVITTKPIEPGEEEISRNSRARSAKMRVAEKL